ncbi:MAG: hypothetical protein ABI365_06750 [Lysobacteraceae bacterium]
MDSHIMIFLQSAASILGGVMVFAALLLLWRKSQSEWLLLALAAKGASLLCSVAFWAVPSILSSTPIVLLIWPITGLLMAIGLLGYAVVESKRIQVST